MSTARNTSRSSPWGFDLFTADQAMFDFFVRGSSRDVTSAQSPTDDPAQIPGTPVHIVPRGEYFNPASPSRTTALPDPDAFQNTYLGLYLDPFHNGHNRLLIPDILNGSPNNFRRDLLRSWYNAGCRCFHIAEGVQDIRTGATPGLTAITHMLSQIVPPMPTDVDIIVNPSVNCRQLTDQPMGWFGLGMMDILGALVSASANTLLPFTALYIDEPESCVLVNGRIDLARLTTFTNGLNQLVQRVQQQLGLVVYLTTYDFTVISHLMAQCTAHLRSGALVLCPDKYYEVSFRDRQRFWLAVAEEADTHGIPRERIRPTISPQCDFCGSDPGNMNKTNPQCVPRWLPWDFILFSQLGFAGPLLYMQNGISQEFYEYVLVSSWMTGCIPSLAIHSRPRTYGEMNDLVADPQAMHQIAMEICLTYRIQSQVHENHLSCSLICNDRVNRVMRKMNPDCTRRYPWMPLCAYGDDCP